MAVYARWFFVVRLIVTVSLSSISFAVLSHIQRRKAAQRKPLFALFRSPVAKRAYWK